MQKIKGEILLEDHRMIDIESSGFHTVRRSLRRLLQRALQGLNFFIS